MAAPIAKRGHEQPTGGDTGVLIPPPPSTLPPGVADWGGWEGGRKRGVGGGWRQGGEGVGGWGASRASHCSRSNPIQSIQSNPSNPIHPIQSMMPRSLHVFMNNSQCHSVQSHLHKKLSWDRLGYFPARSSRLSSPAPSPHPHSPLTPSPTHHPNPNIGTSSR